MIRSLYSTNEPLEDIVIVSCEKDITKSNDVQSTTTTNLNLNPQIDDYFFDKT